MLLLLWEGNVIHVLPFNQLSKFTFSNSFEYNKKCVYLTTTDCCVFRKYDEFIGKIYQKSFLTFGNESGLTKCTIGLFRMDS